MNFDRYRILIFGSAILLIVLLSEFICYLAISSLSITGILEDPVVIESPYHPYIGSINAPNIAIDTGKPGMDPGVVIYTDHRGYSVTPWYEHDAPEIKIAILGGSTVFGVGSSNNHRTVPSIVEKLANESTGRKVEVFNLGLRGANSYQEMVILNRFLLEEDNVDLVLSISGYNDAYQGSVEPSIEGRFVGLHNWKNTAPIIHLLEKGTLSQIQLELSNLYIQKAREFSYIIDCQYRIIRKIISIAKGDPLSDFYREQFLFKKNISMSDVAH